MKSDRTLEQLQDQAERLRERLRRVERQILNKRLNAITEARLRGDLRPAAESLAVGQ